MSSESTLTSLSIPAAGDLSSSQYRVVDINASGSAALVSTAGGKNVGILQNKPTAAGRAAAVAISGVSRIVLGGTVAAGAEVISDVNGAGIAQSSAGQFVIGTALRGGSAGQIGEVLIKRYQHV